MKPNKLDVASSHAWLAWLFAGVGGCVDAIGYLLLVHLFIAHMSGNSVAFGVALSQQSWTEAAWRASPIPVFILGVITGAVLTEYAISVRMRSKFVPTLVLELLCLAGFLYFASRYPSPQHLPPQISRHLYLLVALPAFAMGLQNATFRRVGHHRVRTTYVTGMLTNFAEACALLLLKIGQSLRSVIFGMNQGQASGTLREVLDMVLFGGVWLAYLSGAVIGGLLEAHLASAAVIAPIAVLAVIVVWDLKHPILISPSDYPPIGH